MDSKNYFEELYEIEIESNKVRGYEIGDVFPLSIRVDLPAVKLAGYRGSNNFRAVVEPVDSKARGKGVEVTKATIWAGEGAIKELRAIEKRRKQIEEKEKTQFEKYKEDVGCEVEVAISLCDTALDRLQVVRALQASKKDIRNLILFDLEKELQELSKQIMRLQEDETQRRQRKSLRRQEIEKRRMEASNG